MRLLMAAWLVAVAAPGAAQLPTAGQGEPQREQPLVAPDRPVSGETAGQGADLPPAEPRFTRNGDGTVTDNRTGLVWLEDASCGELPRSDDTGRAYGSTAILAAGELAEPACGLSDGSQTGDWRLPSRSELEGVLDLGFTRPALSNAAGTARWTPEDPFVGIESSYYWSSTPLAEDPTYVWCVDLYDGVVFYAYEVNYYYVWPVRGGG